MQGKKAPLDFIGSLAYNGPVSYQVNGTCLTGQLPGREAVAYTVSDQNGHLVSKIDIGERSHDREGHFVIKMGTRAAGEEVENYAGKSSFIYCGDRRASHRASRFVHCRTPIPTIPVIAIPVASGPKGLRSARMPVTARRIIPSVSVK